MEKIIFLAVIIIACSALKNSSHKNTNGDKATVVAPATEKAALPALSETLPAPELLDDTTKWVADAAANEIKCPIEATQENIDEGMLLYKKRCRSCHGKYGDGQGVGAEDCKVPPSDFTKPAFTGQTDGAIYWKITTGRNDMESYKDELEAEEIWKVILYIKTFAKEEGE